MAYYVLWFRRKMPSIVYKLDNIVLIGGVVLAVELPLGGRT